MKTPRAYQARTFDAVLGHFRSGKRSPLIVAPTGAGKTYMCAWLSDRHMSRGGRGVVWLAHRRELVSQAAATLRAFGLEVGASGLGASAPVQCATVQTLLARGEVPPASLVIFDEAHHFAADDWGRLVEVYRDAYAIGATATPERLDGRGLGGNHDSIVVAAQPQELIDAGVLVPCRLIRPRRIVPRNGIALDPVDAFFRYTPNARGAVVFAASVKLAHEYAMRFKQKGVEARTITGTMSADERDASLARFARGEVRVLTNVNVLTEGWDCPPADVAIIARKIMSTSLWIQVGGRVMRAVIDPSTDAPALRLDGSRVKPFCTVLDLPGVSWLHGRLEEPREYDLERGILKHAPADIEAERKCRVCKSLLDSDAYICPACGALNEPRAQKDPKVTNEEVEEVDWRTEVRKQPTPKRVANLRKWFGEARMRGYKPNWPLVRFKVVYGYFPSREIIAAAKEAS